MYLTQKANVIKKKDLCSSRSFITVLIIGEILNSVDENKHVFVAKLQFSTAACSERFIESKPKRSWIATAAHNIFISFQIAAQNKERSPLIFVEKERTSHPYLENKNKI